MFEVHVEHHRDVGLDDRGEPRDLAARVGAAFDDHRAMRIGEHQQRHRHADEIVEIAERGKRRAENRARERGGDFLGGGFAGRAADRDERNRMRGADSMRMMMRESVRARRGCRQPRRTRGPSTRRPRSTIAAIAPRCAACA